MTVHLLHHGAIFYLSETWAIIIKSEAQQPMNASINKYMLYYFLDPKIKFEVKLQILFTKPNIVFIFCRICSSDTSRDICKTLAGCEYTG